MKSNEARREWVAAFHIRFWTPLEHNNSIKKELPCNPSAQVEDQCNSGYESKKKKHFKVGKISTKVASPRNTEFGSQTSWKHFVVQKPTTKFSKPALLNTSL